MASRIRCGNVGSQAVENRLLRPGNNRYGHISPEEPRRGPDGSVFVQTLGCGIERITGAASDQPTFNWSTPFPVTGVESPPLLATIWFRVCPSFTALSSSTSQILRSPSKCHGSSSARLFRLIGLDGTEDGAASSDRLRDRDCIY